MNANITTNKGIYLGQGIAPFPKLHAFVTNESGSNKSFYPSLEGVFEVSEFQLSEKFDAEMQAKASFFATLPHISLD